MATTTVQLRDVAIVSDHVALSTSRIVLEIASAEPGGHAAIDLGVRAAKRR